MVAGSLGPRVDEVDIGFGSAPGHGGAVSGHRIREIADVDRDNPACERIQVDAWNANIRGIAAAVIGRQRFIVKMRHAGAELGEKGRRENPIVVDARTVCPLHSRAFEGPLAGPPKLPNMGAW